MVLVVFYCSYPHGILRSENSVGSNRKTQEVYDFLEKLQEFDKGGNGGKPLSTQFWELLEKDKDGRFYDIVTQSAVYFKNLLEHALEIYEQLDPYEKELMIMRTCGYAYVKEEVNTPVRALEAFYDLAHKWYPQLAQANAKLCAFHPSNLLKKRKPEKSIETTVQEPINNVREVTTTHYPDVVSEMPTAIMNSGIDDKLKL